MSEVSQLFGSDDSSSDDGKIVDNQSDNMVSQVNEDNDMDTEIENTEITLNNELQDDDNFGANSDNDESGDDLQQSNQEEISDNDAPQLQLELDDSDDDSKNNMEGVVDAASSSSDEGGIIPKKMEGSSSSDEGGTTSKKKITDNVSDLFGDASDVSDASDIENKTEEIVTKSQPNKKDLFGSDDSDDEEVIQKDKVDNLFGDADDISSDEEKPEGEDVTIARPQIVDEEDDEVEPTTQGISDADEPNEDKENLETRIEVEIPKINTDLGKSIHFVRFPNFLSVESRPFDPAIYEDEIEEDELLDEEGRTRLKLKVENTIRWRKFVDENGIELTESNARVVKWSDGSMSLHLGSEIFDVHQMSLQGDHNHLFIRQGTGLQGQAVFKTKLSFRPNSTKSATHKRIINQLATRYQSSQQKVRVLPIAGQDPESRKIEMIKKEEEELKAHVRREAQARRVRERAHQKGLMENYLDDTYDNTTADDDDGAVSVNAIKNKFKSGNHQEKHNIYSTDSDSDGEKRLIDAKLKSSDDENDDDDFGIEAKRRKVDDSHHEGRKKRYVVSDDDEDEEDKDVMPAGSSQMASDDEGTGSHARSPHSDRDSLPRSPQSDEGDDQRSPNDHHDDQDDHQQLPQSNSDKEESDAQSESDDETSVKSPQSIASDDDVPEKSQVSSDDDIPEKSQVSSDDDTF